MPPADIVRALLEQAPGEAVCNACLAFACSTSLSQMLELTAALIGDNNFTSGSGTCVSCRRATTTIVYSKRAKMEVKGDVFHRSWWQLLLSDARIRLSRSLSPRSRERIADARKRMNE